MHEWVENIIRFFRVRLTLGSKYQQKDLEYFVDKLNKTVKRGAIDYTKVNRIARVIVMMTSEKRRKRNYKIKKR